ncbi:MAG: HU family DNA-binding protein [Deltaproteobacteria bacterium]|nr:MAG: HU family DNA-binding protein [Deltaproteobacteria bacterium]
MMGSAAFQSHSLSFETLKSLSRPNRASSLSRDLRVYERRGRNPQTGESIMLAPRKVVTFKRSCRLIERINEEG